MYCLRLFLPLLLLPLPLSLSPIHLTTLLILTYALNRPCPYCSFILIVLFGSSCAWQRCFWGLPESSYTWSSGLNASDTNTSSGILDENWILYFLPRLYTTPPTPDTTLSQDTDLPFLSTLTNSTISSLVLAAQASTHAAIASLQQPLTPTQPHPALAALAGKVPWSEVGQGVGTTWLRNLVGRSEWTLPCVGVKVVL